MNRLLALILIFGVAFAACDAKKAEAQKAEDSKAETQKTEDSKAEAPKGAAADTKETKEEPKAAKRAEVSKEGSKFEPAIEKAQIPDGAFICDMGTVHYARMEEGDGKCPVCGMKLKPHKH